MAITNHQRVGRALTLLRDGLAPFVEREVVSICSADVETAADRYIGPDPKREDRPTSEWDSAVLLKLMWSSWNEVFRQTLGPAERSLVSELRDARNKWAHQESFSGDDAYRAIDSAARLLTAVSAEQAEEIEQMKMELLRLRFDEKVRREKRKTASQPVDSPVSTGLRPWREVVHPHQDVASGRYQQAEFAADLWQVHIGEGTQEYSDPEEFFRRTYLTESLQLLLKGAMQRLTGSGGDPVVQLQTNFGGGKTHSMLALYHAFSGASSKGLAGLDELMASAGVNELPTANRVVLVGNRVSPGNPLTKKDGTEVRTLWGELAWQLGHAAGGEKEARKAFDRVRADDERATSPGDTLRELMNDYGPCLVLIDEWVAYARQLHDESDLPAGSFETHFTFAQALTESARAAKKCLLVISLPASDTSGSPHAVADDVEVGGERGRAALSRLRNVIGRVEASWRPASAEEGFEIVRRRLFEPLTTQAQFLARDTVAREFADLYRTQKQEFPSECSKPDYEKRLKAAYPIHPEIFDRLYTDWSTLVKFQRTRGVLRLMSAVIHTSWVREDRNPLVLPANIAIDDQRVRFELTRYLSDNWVPVIDKDVDGPNSLPLRIDGDVTNLGKYHACRRVARTVYLGSAPTSSAAHTGIEDRQIKLGCVMPGESPAIFGDALRRLASSATYLYQDGPRYWYSTQPTVTKLAEDRAAQLLREPDKVAAEIGKRVRADLRQTGDFTRIHPLPESGQDVPDDMDARLVVLGLEHPYTKEKRSPAEVRAREILESRGTAPRQFQNTLVFLAVDQTRLQDLDEAARKYLAWNSIVDEREELGLTPYQMKQAETQRSSADGVVAGRLPEAYQWLLVPLQTTPDAGIEWQAMRLSGRDALAVRASKKLKSEELLITTLGGTRLRLELDRVPLWRGDYVEVRQLVEDFSRYLYLPRLQGPGVLLGAVENGVSLLTWEQDSFAYAESFDEEGRRYRGLRAGQSLSLTDPDAPGILVSPAVAMQQIIADEAEARRRKEGEDGAQSEREDAGSAAQEFDDAIASPLKVTSFHGSATLDSARVGLDASRIADEVISHLSGLVGATVRVTMDIEAEIPEGAPDNVVRTVTENCMTLRFDSQGFEEE